MFRLGIIHKTQESDMRRFIGGMAVVALLLGVMGNYANAQIAGNPVYGVTPGTGVTINGDFGRGLNDESGKTNFFGGRVIVGTPAASFWAGGGVVKNGTSEVSFGGGASVHLLKGPAVPVSVSAQAGVGMMKVGDMTILNGTLGPVFTFDVPSPTLTVQPWVSPRLHLRRMSGGLLLEAQSDLGFGGSGGINVTLPTGLGFHAAVDFMTIGDPSVKPLMVGAGVHYTVAVPSLGVM